jgi:hypothetical protein
VTDVAVGVEVEASFPSNHLDPHQRPLAWPNFQADCRRFLQWSLVHATYCCFFDIVIPPEVLASSTIQSVGF